MGAYRWQRSAIIRISLSQSIRFDNAAGSFRTGVGAGLPRFGGRFRYAAAAMRPARLADASFVICCQQKGQHTECRGNGDSVYVRLLRPKWPTPRSA